MGKKVTAVVIIVLVAILALVSIYSVTEFSDVDSSDLTELTVYSEGPVPLSDIIEDIENESYYNGYDNHTLNWMKSLGDKEVFSGNGTFVIMSSSDANKIPSVFATDVIITETFECNVLENHSLGDIKYPKDVLLVEHVNYLGESIEDIPGGGA